MNQCISRHITHSMDFEGVKCMSVIINLMCLWWWVICNKQFEEFALSTQSNVIFLGFEDSHEFFSHSKISEKVFHKGSMVVEMQIKTLRILTVHLDTRNEGNWSSNRKHIVLSEK